MTHLVRVPLGNSPLSGKQSFAQCVTFKQQMRSLLGSADGAWLMLVEDPEKQTIGVEAVYDAHTEGAKEWAEKAAEAAPEVWQKLSERRRARE